MPRFNVVAAQDRILEVCRFPVPKSALHLVLTLKDLDNFYQKTRTDKVVPLMRKYVLQDLINKDAIVEYTPQDAVWEKARRLVAHYYSKGPEPAPRKLNTLYQINFFHLANQPSTLTLTLSKETNLDLVALTYGFVKDKTFENFPFEILNLMYCYVTQELHDRVRTQVYGLDFTEKEQEQLEKLLGYGEELKELFEGLPFKPDIDRALTFLEKL